MEIFYLTIKQMLMMFTLIATGVLLRKRNLLSEYSGTILAKLETFIFIPALLLYTQIGECTVEVFKENAIVMIYGLVIVVAAVFVSYPLSKCFVKNDAVSSEKSYERNIYKYALTFGNYGFMGNFIILGIWGNGLFYKYTLFTFFVGVLCYSWGLCILIPKDKSAGVLVNLKKGLLTPPIIALVLGMMLGLLNFKQYIPDFLMSALKCAGDCQGPVAMILAGIVIGGYSFRELLLNKKVYAVSCLRLVIIPAVIMIILKLLGINDEVLTLALIAFSTPLGLNTIVYPAAYGGETKTGAAMALISHALSVLTIPIMYLIFMVLM